MGFMKSVKLMDAHPQAFCKAQLHLYIFLNGDTCHRVPIEYRHKNVFKKNLAGFYIV
jgi:hypothetical protein